MQRDCNGYFSLIKVGSLCGWNNDYTDFVNQHYKDMCNIYISSKNILTFTPHNHCNNSYKKFYLAEIKVDTEEFYMMLFLL